MTFSSNGFGGPMKYSGTAASGGLNGLLNRDHKRRSGEVPEKAGQLTGRGLAEIVNLLERKLAWYGFRSVEMGPFVKSSGHDLDRPLTERSVAVSCQGRP